MSITAMSITASSYCSVKKIYFIETSVSVVCSGWSTDHFCGTTFFKIAPNGATEPVPDFS
jgi:hypothetical protein